jgi:Mce-associated membrane protein
VTEDHNDDPDTNEEEPAAPVEPDTETERKGRHRLPEPEDEPDVPAMSDVPADVPEVSDEPADEPEVPDEPASVKPEGRINWPRVLAFGVLPGLVLVLALGAGYLKWRDNSVRDSDIARRQSEQTAKDSTAALLSYKPETVEQQLVAARDLLTGGFRDYYTKLTNDVVIPTAKEKQISAVASVPEAGAVSADPNHAVVLAYVNQTVVVGGGVPTDNLTRVRITMDKVDGRWLISKFDPV